ncbi:MAG TPA: hypothetical protein VFZ61_32750, partial [Polyangiales bacterium]
MAVPASGALQTSAPGSLEELLWRAAQLEGCSLAALEEAYGAAAPAAQKKGRVGALVERALGGACD